MFTSAYPTAYERFSRRTTSQIKTFRLKAIASRQNPQLARKLINTRNNKHAEVNFKLERSFRMHGPTNYIKRLDGKMASQKFKRKLRHVELKDGSS